MVWWMTKGRASNRRRDSLSVNAINLARVGWVSRSMTERVFSVGMCRDGHRDLAMSGGPASDVVLRVPVMLLGGLDRIAGYVRVDLPCFPERPRSGGPRR